MGTPIGTPMGKFAQASAPHSARGTHSFVHMMLGGPLRPLFLHQALFQRIDGSPALLLSYHQVVSSGHRTNNPLRWSA
jgi:hypothetical protein